MLGYKKLTQEQAQIIFNFIKKKLGGNEEIVPNYNFPIMSTDFKNARFKISLTEHNNLLFYLEINNREPGLL